MWWLSIGYLAVSVRLSFLLIAGFSGEDIPVSCLWRIDFVEPSARSLLISGFPLKSSRTVFFWQPESERMQGHLLPFCRLPGPLYLSSTHPPTPQDLCGAPSILDAQWGRLRTKSNCLVIHYFYICLQPLECSSTCLFFHILYSFVCICVLNFLSFFLNFC